jgi:hypothetical protein
MKKYKPEQLKSVNKKKHDNFSVLSKIILGIRVGKKGKVTVGSYFLDANGTETIYDSLNSACRFSDVPKKININSVVWWAYLPKFEDKA